MVISGDAKLIAAAFVKARREMVATVAKDAKGNYGKYATLAALVEATTDVLAKNGLAIIQEAHADEQGLIVDTWLIHESGATMQFASLPMPLTNRTAQAVGSAITYARRYQLAAVCGLAPDDDDGQAAVDAQVARKAAPPRRTVDAATSTPNGAQQPATPATDGDVVFDQPTKPRAGKDQLTELDKLGATFYGDEWPARKPELVEAVSRGATKEAAELLVLEATKLIDGIQRKMAALAQAKEAQAA